MKLLKPAAISAFTASAAAFLGVIAFSSTTAIAATTALCSDVRTLHETNALDTNGAWRYVGQELVTQNGDDVTVIFLPDQLAGLPETSIQYERITRKDAEALGFVTASGMAVYMLHGDADLPAQYVILPLKMEDAAARGFRGAYGTMAESGQYDASSSTTMSCELR